MASMKKRLVAAVAAAGLSIGLGGCMGDYGYGGVGYASDYYGGYGNGYGYGPSLAYGGYGGYGGWYNDFYYPGTGIYVFDRSGRRSRWNDGQRRYWEGRRGQWQGRGGRWQGQRADWRGQAGPGRPSANRPDRPDRGQGYGNRGGWRNNGLNAPRTQAQANAILGRPNDYRPPNAGASNGWRGQGAGSMSRGGGFQGQRGGWGGRGGGHGGGRGGGRGGN
jgi:hypothetical protein